MEDHHDLKNNIGKEISNLNASSKNADDSNKSESHNLNNNKTGKHDSDKEIDKEHHKHHRHAHAHHKHKAKKSENIGLPVIILTSVLVVLVIFNQFVIFSLGVSIDGLEEAVVRANEVQMIKFGDNSNNLANINLDEIKSTGHTIAAVFPVEDIVTFDDAMEIIFPTGTPEYGPDLGVSFDEPVESLAKLARMYPALKVEIQQNNPEAWSRFMNLASRPLGISCEFCCGIQAVGIDKNGNSACGCQHNPALLTVALYLSAYSDYNDGEILREVMRWKTLFFPKDMIGLAMTVAGGDTSSLESLPGMVGGC